MRQIERVADGRRRFFQADGVVSDVLLRDRKSHQDRGLERGRDYEIETGGVSLRQVPKQGATVIILAGDRVREDSTVVERIVRVATEHSVDPPAFSPTVRGVEPRSAELDSNQSSRRMEQPATVEVQSTAPALADQPDELVFTKDADGGLTIELDALKRCLVLATKETNDATISRTPEWQDELARRTAVMLRAQTMAGVKAAFIDIEGYIRGAS